MSNLIGKNWWTILLLGMALVGSGCGSQRDTGDLELTTSEAQTVPATPTPTLPTEITGPAAPISPVSPVGEADMVSTEPIEGSETALEAAMADLSEQTGVPADRIKLVSMEAVEWSDASLGCPQEGYMYAQVITPGYKITLEAEDQQYIYHTDQKSNVVLCETP